MAANEEEEESRRSSSSPWKCWSQCFGTIDRDQSVCWGGLEGRGGRENERGMKRKNEREIIKETERRKLSKKQNKTKQNKKQTNKKNWKKKTEPDKKLKLVDEQGQKCGWAGADERVVRGCEVNVRRLLCRWAWALMLKNFASSLRRTDPRTHPIELLSKRLKERKLKEQWKRLYHSEKPIHGQTKKDKGMVGQAGRKHSSWTIGLWNRRNSLFGQHKKAFCLTHVQDIKEPWRSSFYAHDTD